MGGGAATHTAGRSTLWMHQPGRPARPTWRSVLVAGSSTRRCASACMLCPEPLANRLPYRLSWVSLDARRGLRWRPPPPVCVLGWVGLRPSPSCTGGKPHPSARGTRCPLPAPTCLSPPPPFHPCRPRPALRLSRAPVGSLPLHDKPGAVGRLHVRAAGRVRSRRMYSTAGDAGAGSTVAAARGCQAAATAAAAAPGCAQHSAAARGPGHVCGCGPPLPPPRLCLGLPPTCLAPVGPALCGRPSASDGHMGVLQFECYCQGALCRDEALAQVGGWQVGVPVRARMRGGGKGVSGKQRPAGAHDAAARRLPAARCMCIMRSSPCSGRGGASCGQPGRQDAGHSPPGAPDVARSRPRHAAAAPPAGRPAGSGAGATARQRRQWGIEAV
jgi:hypothetical protein